jgi:hypothetical protein
MHTLPVELTWLFLFFFLLNFNYNNNNRLACNLFKLIKLTMRMVGIEPTLNCLKGNGSTVKLHSPNP